MKSILELKSFKNSKRKLTMVTCYDHWSAKILAKTDVDILLVGDSLAMVVHGHSNTLSATLEMMCLHTESVARARPNQLIVADLPFLAHRKGRPYLMKCVDQLMKAGAQALKIETGPGQESVVKYISDSGVPVIGHLGLTPQYIHQFGGFKVQGRDEKTHEKILQQAHELVDAGCHALVLECVPSALAAAITEQVPVPTVGIGAGSQVDGQVLVLHDLLGFDSSFKPRFVRHFAQGESLIQKAIQDFSQSVQDNQFPNLDESYL